MNPAQARADAAIIAENAWFKEAAGARVLVTGVTGMVGSCLAWAFLEADRMLGLGLEVHGMARNAAKIGALFAGTLLRPLPADVAELPAGLPRFDYVLHAASPVGPAVFANHPAEVVRANLSGTVNLLDRARRDSCRRFLFVSTHEVYGQGKDVWREEDAGVLDFLDPRACYPESKRAGENACVSYHKEYGLHAVIARLSRLYGPAMNLESGLFVCDLVKDVLAGRPATVKGGGDLIRPLCHMADAGDALIRILCAGEAGRAYNVGPDEASTIADIARLIGRLGGTGHLIGAGTVVGGSVLDTTRLKELGWRQRVALADGLKELIGK